MPEYLTSEQERFLLLKKIFPQSYPGRDLKENVLFKVCRQLQIEYCLRFKDNGYNEDYKSFDSEKVTLEVAKMIKDTDLIKLFEDNKAELPEYRDFYGREFTYIGKERTLLKSSAWIEIRRTLNEILTRYQPNGKIVLNAIYDVNFVFGKRGKKYYEVMTIAKNRGLLGNWQNILSELILSKVIDDRKYMTINEEMRPLVEEILGR